MAVDQHILLTTDIILFGKRENERKFILLIQRKNDPFQGKWAFPGGFVEDDEDLNTAAVRELQEETGILLESNQLRQLGAWGAPDRDPRGRTVTVVFVAEVDVNDHKVQAADDAGDAKWWPLNDLPPLAFDHDEILRSTQIEPGEIKKKLF